MSTTRVPVNGVSNTYIDRNRKEKVLLKYLSIVKKNLFEIVLMSVIFSVHKIS